MSRHLPALLAEIAEIVGDALKDKKAGVEAALKLAQARGGQRVHIPAQARADHWLVETLGQRAADAICAHYRVGEEGERGAELDIPLGAGGSYRTYRRSVTRAMQAAEEAGLSANAAAAAVGTTRRAVFRFKAAQKRRKHDRTLFD